MDHSKSGSDLLGVARLQLRAKDWKGCLDTLDKAAERGLASPGLTEVLDGVERAGVEVERVKELRARLGRTAAPQGRPREEGQAARGGGDSGKAARRLERSLGSVPLVDVVGRLLAAEVDPAKILDVALDLTLTSTGAELGCLILREGERLLLERSRGLESEALPAEFSRSILAEALGSGRPVVSSDAGRDARFQSAPSVAEAGLRAVVCVPITDPEVPEDCVGAIYLADRQTAGRFGPEAVAVLEHLAVVIAGPLLQARELEAQRRELASARAAVHQARKHGPERFVGKSKALQAFLDMLARAAHAKVPVLIEGESGTGKELAARLLHESSSAAQGPFVGESCAALSEELLESELFGVVRGAFTDAHEDRIGLFERAHGGTLFLDDLDSLSLAAQAKLLRVVQEGEVRPLGSAESRRVEVRLVTATQSLARVVQEGRFRQDLYYRLSVMRLAIPPLRERMEDLPALVQHLLEKLAEERGGSPTTLSEKTMKRLHEHGWRGNVRELENVLRRLDLRGDDGAPWLGAESFAGDERGTKIVIDPAGPLPSLREGRDAFDRELLKVAMARCDGNASRAARELKLGRSHFYAMLKRLGVR